MADFGTPVASPNPVGQGLQTLSGILGIRQAQQNLQTGAIEQQTAQAKSQQVQQDASQRSNLAGFMQHFDPAKHVGSDGTLDLDSVLTDPNLRQAAGDQFPAVAQQFIQLKSGQLQTKQQLASLNGDLRNQFSSTVGSLRTDPDVVADNPQGRAKVQQAMGDFAETGGADAARVANTYAAVVNHVPQGKLTQALSNFQLQAMDASTQAGRQAPNLADTGNNLTNVNPQAAPVTLGKKLPPQIISPPGGVPTEVGGSGKGGPLGNQYPGPSPTDQDVKNFGDYQKDLNSRVQLASDMLPRLKLTETAADAIRTGAGTGTRASIAKSLQGLGAPQGLVDAVSGGNLADVQEAEKMMFQTTMSGLRQAMSNEPSRVAEFEAANKVFPTVDTDPRARAKILGFMSDQGQRDYAEQQALTKARTDGTFNPATWESTYQKQLRGNQIAGTPESQVPTASGSPAGSPLKAPNQKQLDYLHAHPDTADKFKAKFGFVPQ